LKPNSERLLWIALLDGLQNSPIPSRAVFNIWAIFFASIRRAHEKILSSKWRNSLATDRSAAAKKAAITRKRKAAGQKAAKTKKRRAAAAVGGIDGRDG
jgi:hypothetical protein